MPILPATNARRWDMNQMTEAAHQFTGGKMPQAEQEAFVNGPMAQSARLRKIVHGMWQSQLVSDFVRGNMTPAANAAFRLDMQRSSQLKRLVTSEERLLGQLQRSKHAYLAGVLDPGEAMRFEETLVLFPELKAEVAQEKKRMDEEQRIATLVYDYVNLEMSTQQTSAFELLMSTDPNLRLQVETEQRAILIRDYLDDHMSPEARVAFETDMANDDTLKHQVDKRKERQLRDATRLRDLGFLSQ